MKKLIIPILIILLGCSKKDDFIPKDITIKEIAEKADSTMLFAIVDNDTIIAYDTAIAYQNINGIWFMIEDSVTEGDYLPDGLRTYKSFNMCLGVKIDSSTLLGFCDFSTQQSYTGFIEVTRVRNDSIWAIWDIDIEGVFSNRSVNVKGFLNGMPY